jgi:hypothetical protein
MVLFAVATVLCVNLISITTANADPYWTNAIEMPGLAELNQTAAVAGPIVCTSADNCVSGGQFTDSGAAQQAFLSQETSGVWSSAMEIGAALNVGGNASVTALSCPTAGNCTAVGFYNDDSTAEHTFVISQTNGTWGFPTQVPDFTTLKFDDAEEMDTLSCTSNTSCVGIGTYFDNSTDLGQPLVFTETNGVWATPTLAPGFTTFNTDGVAVVSILECPSAGTCVASGTVVAQTPVTLEPFFVYENNGVWSDPVEVPGVAELSDQNVGLVDSLSCGAPGDCSAGGNYLDKSNESQAFLINEVGGVWGTATQLFATQVLGSGLVNSLNGVDCSSAGNCSAVGTYDDAQGLPQPFELSESNHVWSAASEIPGIQALNSSAGSDLSTISCSAVGVCSAGGTFTDSASKTQAFVVNEANGTWADPIEIPGTSSLNKGGAASVSEVSCSSDGGCGVQGSYTDESSNIQLFVSNSSAVAPTEVSSAPRHVTAADKRGVITVRWSAPANNGGTAITSYTVVSLPKSKTCVTHATSCTFKGLNKKLHYTFEVRATNAQGASALSAKSNSVRDT